MPLTEEPMEQREQSDACIDSAESRQRKIEGQLLGTNADGSKNEEYCIYCYKDGVFTSDCTMEEMADFCAQYVAEYNKHTGQNLGREEYKQLLLQFFPTLKRWQR